MATPKRVIAVSFKDDEIWLYEILKQYSSPGSTIKDLLKPMFQQPKQPEVKSPESRNILDF